MLNEICAACESIFLFFIFFVFVMGQEIHRSKNDFLGMVYRQKIEDMFSYFYNYEGV